jgi:Pyruvate/2-oxoacid:ferredoxin oxidoreductase gamma subunit
MPGLIASANRVNDFVVKFANVNGTGSASANSLIMKAIFRMGVPVTGKNYFPSNIQGLPTWYEIRVTRDAYAARAAQVDIMVAMNAETYSRDVRELSSGGYLIYDSTWPRSAFLQRGDISVIAVPLAKLINENFDGVRNRILLKNIAYAGVLAALIDVDLEVINGLLSESYGKKPKLLDSNTKALRLGFDYVKEHLTSPLPLRVEHMDKTRGHIMIDGNTAAGLGCVYAGATVGAWYPITPSTSLMDAFKGFCERFRVDPDTGERNFAVLQAEDELAAVGMVLGASWNGARAFTPTSGPGISLMNEFVGLAYYAEVPCVIFDVQRVGPSTGMPTRTQQSDIMLCAYASHGDTRHVLLFPANPEECFYLAVQAFDIAERLQTPVFVMSDLDIGMNDWMCPDLQLGRCLQAGSRQDAVGGGTRRTGEILPLRGSRRRCNHLSHAAGHQLQGRLLHARLRPQSVRRIHRGFRRIPGCARSAEAKIRGRAEISAEAGDARQGRQRGRHREPRQLRRRNSRGARCSRKAENRRRLSARQIVSVQQRRRSVLEIARRYFRGRAESRRAVQIAVDARDGGGEIQAQFHLELQRTAHVGRSDRQ